MTSIRVRPPIDANPPQFTVEWYSIGGDGSWIVLKNGRMGSAHYFKWQAKRRARRLRKEHEA